MGHWQAEQEENRSQRCVAKREPAAIFKFVLVLKARMVALERQGPEIRSQLCSTVCSAILIIAHS